MLDGLIIINKEASYLCNSLLDLYPTVSLAKVPDSLHKYLTLFYLLKNSQELKYIG